MMIAMETIKTIWLYHYDILGSLKSEEIKRGIG